MLAFSPGRCGDRTGLGRAPSLTARGLPAVRPEPPRILQQEPRQTEDHRQQHGTDGVLGALHIPHDLSLDEEQQNMGKPLTTVQPADLADRY